jgi:hypothetical protein
VSERFLVTGALGCLGAWTVYLLVGESIDVVTYDVSEDDRGVRHTIATFRQLLARGLLEPPG